MKSHYSLRKRLALKQQLFSSKEKWAMFVELIRAKSKSSDYNTAFGMLWGFSVPLVTLGVLYVMFRGKFSLGISYYPLYLLIGIVWLNFFIGSTTAILKSFVNNRVMLHHSSVPREYIILTEVSVHVYKFFIGIVFCVILSAGFKVLSLSGLLLLFPLLLAYLGLVFGVGCLLLCSYCLVNDMEYLWSILAQLCFFITPVFFGLHSISPVTRTFVVYCNPLTVFLLAARNLLMGGGGLDFGAYWSSLFVGCLFFTVGYLIYIQIESIIVERT